MQKKNGGNFEQISIPNCGFSEIVSCCPFVVAYVSITYRLAVNLLSIFLYHRQSVIFIFGLRTKSSSRDSHLKIKYFRIFESFECNLHHVLFKRQEILDRFYVLYF